MSLTTWQYSPTTEVQRLSFIAYQIGRFFYQINGFTVLPQSPATPTASQVIFPDLAYPRSFWQETKRLNYNQPIRVSPETVSKLTPLLLKLPQPDKPSFNHPVKPFDPQTHPLFMPWQQAEPQVLDFFDHLIPDLHQRLTQITIFPTLFGTQASFNRLTSDQTQLEIYLRFDACLDKIIEVIFDALERQTLLKDCQATWQEAEMVSNWLLSASKLKAIVNQYQSGYQAQTLIAHLRTQKPNPELAKQSQAFLTKLGYFTDHTPLELKQGQVYLKDQPINHFTPREHTLLTRLITDRFISTDQVADIIFGSDDEYSLYAIAKCIQRLRDKLEDYGLSGSCIHTLRGEGYALR